MANSFVASNKRGSDGKDEVEDKENSVKDTHTEGEEGVDEDDNLDDNANRYTESIGSSAKEVQDKSCVGVGKSITEKGDNEYVWGKGLDNTGLDVDNVNCEGSASSTENTCLGEQRAHTLTCAEFTQPDIPESLKKLASEYQSTILSGVEAKIS